MTILTRTFYDYNDIAKQIETKHSIVLRDYISPSQVGDDGNDFWYFANDKIFHECCNSSVHYFDPWYELKNAKETWQKEVLRMFVDFLEENGIRREIEVYIVW